LIRVLERCGEFEWRSNLATQAESGARKCRRTTSAAADACQGCNASSVGRRLKRASPREVERLDLQLPRTDPGVVGGAVHVQAHLHQQDRAPVHYVENSIDQLVIRPAVLAGDFRAAARGVL
jgi:hypothetical protein